MSSIKTLKSLTEREEQDPGSETTLGTLARQIKRRRSVVERLRSLLPEDLAPHVIDAEHDGALIHCIVDSAPAATRLRFLTRELCERLNACDWDGEGDVTRVESLRVVVSPERV